LIETMSRTRSEAEGPAKRLVGNIISLYTRCDPLIDNKSIYSNGIHDIASMTSYDAILFNRKYVLTTLPAICLMRQLCTISSNQLQSVYYNRCIHSNVSMTAIILYIIIILLRPRSIALERDLKSRSLCQFLLFTPTTD